MKVNWPEALWVNSPLRYLVQRREIGFFRRTRELEPGARVLEIGCGRGAGAELIRRTFHPAWIEGVDLDPRMIGLALRRRLPETAFRVADAQSLPYPDGCMDAVFNFGIVHHLEDWRKGLREIHRVLKPDGCFYFEEIYPDLYANAVLRHLLRHPREDRFRGPEFRGELLAAGLQLLAGYKESRYRILAVAVKTAPDGGRP
jgi:ubiquinone/menaquinone biosynthesis C-methylase UbiE